MFKGTIGFEGRTSLSKVWIVGQSEDEDISGVVTNSFGPDGREDVVQEFKFLDNVLLKWCALGMPMVFINLSVTRLDSKGKIIITGLMLKNLVEFLKIDPVVRVNKNAVELCSGSCSRQAKHRDC